MRLVLRLDYTSSKSIQDAKMRFIIRTAEGTRITMASTSNTFLISANQINSLEIYVDTRRLVPGRYTLSPVIYEVNEFGGDSNLDGLKDAYCFEVLVTPGFNNNMPWQPRYWGYTYCDDLEIKPIAEEDYI